MQPEGSSLLKLQDLRLARESFERVGLGLVDAEHREKIRQAQRLAHTVLRLEQTQRCAEPLRSFQTLNQLAQAVAVDIVHVGEIQQDLAIPFAQKLLDERRQELIADPDCEPALKVDDDDIAFLARLDVHVRIIYRMNLVLLFPEDFIAATRVRLSGRRLDAIARIASDEVRIGLVNGRCGIGTIIAPGELEVHFDSDPPPPLPLTLVLALPRPKVLNRVIAAAASMGIKRIFLINAWRVEKSYWKSPRLSADNIRTQGILGLEQARDTIMPAVELRRFFRPFVEDELPAIAKNTLALVAHPGATHECPRDVKKPVTLVVGPEGGFIAEEIASLEKVGFRAVSFGPRILRVETAVAALTARLF